jgi:hypothetical protein
VIALVSQLSLGAVLLPDVLQQQQLAALEAASIFCDGNQTSNHGGKPDHNHRQQAPAICPISITLSLPSVVLAPAPVLPAPPSYVIYARALERPPGRGPPSPTARVGAPRAPPLSIYDLDCPCRAARAALASPDRRIVLCEGNSVSRHSPLLAWLR